MDTQGLPLSCLAHARHAVQEYSVNLYRQDCTVEVVHHVEGPESPAANQCIMHKINRPGLVKHLRRGQQSRITYRQALLTFTTKIEFQQAVNPMHTFIITDMTLPAKYLKKTLKYVEWITLSCLIQHLDHRLITSRIGLVMKHRSAQRERPSRLLKCAVI